MGLCWCERRVGLSTSEQGQAEGCGAVVLEDTWAGWVEEIPTSSSCRAQTDDVDAKHLSENWMRAYLRGADRDQPAFACRWLRVESAAQLRADFCPVLHRCLGKEHNGAMPRLARRVRRRLRVQRIPQPLQPLTKQLVQTRRVGQSELELAPTTVGLQRKHPQVRVGDRLRGKVGAIKADD